MTALAPDASSLRGAQKMSGRTGWVELGMTGDVLWGLCRGSGKNPYQVAVDLAGPAYKCSCPSRKFPCKHALGLLMMWAGGSSADEIDPPAFVAEWVSSRAARQAAAAVFPSRTKRHSTAAPLFPILRSVSPSRCRTRTPA